MDVDSGRIGIDALFPDSSEFIHKKVNTTFRCIDVFRYCLSVLCSD